MIETTEKMLDGVAERVRQHRLELPVTMMLETVRPLAGSISILGEALLPILAPLLGLSAKELQIVIEDREIIPRLIEKLELDPGRGKSLGC